MVQEAGAWLASYRVRAWILGVLLNIAFGITNVLWHAAEQCFGEGEE